MPHRLRDGVVGLIGLLAAMGPSALHAEGQGVGNPVYAGSEWTLVRLDVDVTLQPERGVMTTRGTVTLRLDADRSFGPELLVNTRLVGSAKPAIRFEHVEATGATVTIADSLFAGSMHRAVIHYPRPQERGATIAVRFTCRSQSPVRRMTVAREAAMADWSNAWLPFPRPAAERISITPGLLAAPGTTTLHLPSGWTGVVDGSLTERERSRTGTTEVWETPAGVARGFIAGPYHLTSAMDGQQRVVVYTVSDSSRQMATTVARRTLTAIAVFRERFGAAPFPATYSVVEFPRLPQQSFGAVSEQTHIVVQPPNFAYARGNIQLIAHEVAHAWWGNAVGTSGPGSVWLSEGLAEYGAALVIEAIDGQEALSRFLDFAAIGTDPYYSAAGYFALMREGQDQPLASMGSGAGSWALANSKGVWLFHMLRARIGDTAFFATLRDVATDFRGRALTVDSLRGRFIDAVPSAGLAEFFAQWLDRPGAPVLNVDWHANMDGSRVLMRVTQRQKGPPFRVSVPVDVGLLDGSHASATLDVDSGTQVFELPVAQRPVSLVLDPGHRLLLWRPAYGPPPEGEIIAASMRPSPSVLQAVVGEYRFVDFDKPVRVFARDGMLFIQPEGSAPLRLLPESAGVFRVDGPGKSWVEFDLSRRPVVQLVSVEAGGRERYTARRISSGGR